uniref:Uncharacterized protein n=1 Tax=Utricularia reniformis TaxID=192314 RepID=A0A1Y0B2C4_9LAMI|nr:hypothetical protein AEK19_MT1352 [Utricularia reniformis]ART31550.1 hypothetical protein AEK19_MT1352 [Utricularia reniformis]
MRFLRYRELTNFRNESFPVWSRRQVLQLGGCSRLTTPGSPDMSPEGAFHLDIHVAQPSCLSTTGHIVRALTPV